MRFPSRRRCPLKRSDPDAGNHGWFHIFAVCGLMLLALIALPLLGFSWGTVVLAVALLTCLAAMLVMMRGVGRDR
jgi:Flp pilus assembly protein TadB